MRSFEQMSPPARAGLPEKGKAFCERTSFPEDSLFLDPDCVAYKELALYKGIGRTFFNLATPKVLHACTHGACGRCPTRASHRGSAALAHNEHGLLAQALRKMEFSSFKKAVEGCAHWQLANSVVMTQSAGELTLPCALLQVHVRLLEAAQNG